MFFTRRKHFKRSKTSELGRIIILGKFVIEKRSILLIFFHWTGDKRCFYEDVFRRKLDHFDGAVGLNLEERVRTNSFTILRQYA